MMKGNLDNFDKCENNIRKYQDPAGGNPDYWREKYAPKKHSQTYLKRKYKPQRHSQEYYKEKYVDREKGCKKTKSQKTKESGYWSSLDEADKILVIILIFLGLISYFK